ncbi:MAG: hypothetical protein ACK5BP_13520, partial [Planctomyces sp.]
RNNARRKRKVTQPSIRGPWLYILLRLCLPQCFQFGIALLKFSVGDMQSLRESRDLLMCLGRRVALRTTVTTVNVTGRGLESLSANRRY